MNIIPFRPAANHVLATMRDGYSFYDFPIHNYAIMIGNSILYFSIGILIFNKCVKVAKRKGLLGQY